MVSVVGIMRDTDEIRADQVAIYIRWSTEDQSEGTTLAVQHEACTAYVQSQGWTVRADLIFIDDGISGGTLDRPALSALRARIRERAVGCVVVYKLDRLSRSVVDMVRLVLDEWDGLCHVKSAREPIDTATQAGRMFFYQLVSFAEWERSVIRERTFAGKLRRAHEGRNPGISAAYGYRLGPGGSLVVEPAEAALVQLIFRLYLSGMGCTQIAHRLGEMGHPSPKGRRWSEGQLSRMLSNPIYVGTLVYGKQKTVGGRRCKSDKPLVTKEGAAPPVVDHATFQAVQAVKAGRPGVGLRTGTGRSLSSQSLLSGLLRCRCGHGYCANGGSGPRSRYRYYYCGGSRAKGAGFCPGRRIPQEVLDRAVTQALLAQHRRESTARAVTAQVAAHLEANRRAADLAVQAATRDLAKATGRADRLQRLLLDGQLTPAEYRDLRSQAHDQMTSLRTEVGRRAEEAARAAGALRERQRLLALLEHESTWHVLQRSQQKQLIRHFVARIEAFWNQQGGAVECHIQWRSAQ